MKLLFLLTLALSPFMTIGQCCPYINSIEVIPSSPTTATNVKIVTSVTTPNQGMFISSSHSVNGNTIDIEACYYNGFLTATQTYFDTLDIGILSAGNYTVDFIAYQASDTICDYTDSMSTTLSFTVIEQTSELMPISKEIARVYPNPSNGFFTIEFSEQTNVTNIRVYAISGEIVHQGTFKKEMNLDLETGTYFIEFLENESTIGYHRLLIH